MEHIVTHEQEPIQVMLDAIRKTAEKALESKEATLKFLIDAGILKEESPKKEIEEIK
jgi:hypothetical protein